MHYSCISNRLAAFYQRDARYRYLVDSELFATFAGMKYKDLFIDFDDTDILGALNAGIEAMLFNRWEVDKKDITQQPSFIVDNLRDVMNIL